MYHASDANIVALLAETFAAAAARRASVATGDPLGAAPSTSTCWSSRRQSRVLGEHIVATAGPLRRCDRLFGADVVLTDRPDSGASRGRWVAVLMTRGATAAAARERAAAAVARLAEEHGLELVPES